MAMHHAISSNANILIKTYGPHCHNTGWHHLSIFALLACMPARCCLISACLSTFCLPACFPVGSHSTNLSASHDECTALHPQEYWTWLVDCVQKTQPRRTLRHPGKTQRTPTLCGRGRYSILVAVSDCHPAGDGLVGGHHPTYQTQATG